MNFIDLHSPDSTGIAILMTYAVVWLATLGLALNRSDLHPVTQFLWVLVIILVPFFGVCFYAFIAPPRHIPIARHGKDLEHQF